MNTRNRPGRNLTPAAGLARAPYGLGTRTAALPNRSHLAVLGFPRAIDAGAQPAAPNPACSLDSGKPCRHPLTQVEQNRRLLAHEQNVKNRFDAIVPTLKNIAALQHEPDFVARAQAIAREELGFELPVAPLEHAWISNLDMRELYRECVMRSLRMLAAEAAAVDSGNGIDDAVSFFLDCGYHAVDISPCSDGRLKGLIRYILRLPHGAVRSRKAYAGGMFDIDANIKRWMETELLRFREGRPVGVEAGTRYLKVVAYHWSSSDPAHEGCAAHGSNVAVAAEKAIERLKEFRTAIENSFCCGESIDTLLIGVDTDTDAIKIHVPDADGEMSPHRAVDNLELYRSTVNDDENTARLKIYQAIQAASATQGWGSGNGEPHDGMRRLIATLLINNLSQIEYVCSHWGGRYPDIGHAERFISVGDGFEEFQLRNLAYFAHLHTVEEGTADLDVGIKIFSKINVKHGLPIPIAIHFRYDGMVPGARERAIDRCKRVKSAIEARYGELVERGMLACGMTVQDKRPASPLEPIDAN